MRNYIKALLECEESNNNFDLLCDFIALKKSNLLGSYCDGKINLPSFILLKRLKEKYADLVCLDEELGTLYESAIYCSKIFYARTLKIINIKDNNFERLFSQQAQPIGQQLINILISIKFRTRLIILRQKSPKQNNVLSRILERSITLTKPLRMMFDSLLYKLSLFQAVNYKLTKVIYFTILLFVSAIFWVLGSYFINDLSLVQTTYLNITFCISITIIAILVYPAWNFGKIDIDGRNIVAYKYRVFFNNISNKKMYHIFTL